jgi:hypothetical protein
MNLPVLIHTAKMWVEVFDYESAGMARTPPLPSLASEVLCRGGMGACNKETNSTHINPTRFHIYSVGPGEKVLAAHGGVGC